MRVQKAVDNFRAADRHLLIILVISTIVTIVWSLTQPLLYSSDSMTYVRLAEFLVHRTLPHPIVFIRPPGYSLLLILSGALAFRSFVGILLIQALMAITMPLIVYKTVACYSRRAAFSASLAVIFTLMPQIHSRSIMTEQSFIFGFVLLAWLVVRYRFEPSTNLFWCMIVTTIGLMLLRPSANLFGYLIVGSTLFVEPRRWRRAALAAAVIFLVPGAWASFAAGVSDPNAGGNLVTRIFTGTPSFAGKQLFFDAYVVGQYVPARQNAALIGGSVPRLTFSAENGPASARLLQTLTTFAEKYPQFWTTHPLARPGDDAAGFVEGLRSRPSQQAFGYMWSATDTMLGPAESSRLFGAVALEALAERPTIVLALVDNFISVLFGPMTVYSGAGRLVVLPWIDSTTFPDPDFGTMVRPYRVLPAAALWESAPISYLYGFGYVLLKPALSLTVILTLLFMVAGPMRWPAMVLVSAVLVHHAISAVFAQNLTRYSDEVLPVTVVIAAMGIVAARRRLRPSLCSQDASVIE